MASSGASHGASRAEGLPKPGEILQLDYRVSPADAFRSSDLIGKDREGCKPLRLLTVSAVLTISKMLTPPSSAIYNLTMQMNLSSHHTEVAAYVNVRQGQIPPRFCSSHLHVGNPSYQYLTFQNLFDWEGPYWLARLVLSTNA